MSELLIASFATESALLAAVAEARARGLRIQEIFTPYPVHGLDEAVGARPSRLPWATLAGGLAGLIGAVALQVWAAVIDWPINVGGKPANSSLAFLPISFEGTVLIGGLATAAAFFWRSRLGRRTEPPLVAPGITDDALVLVIGTDGDPHREDIAREMLRARGAWDVQERSTR
jgi:hypothetical protein